MQIKQTYIAAAAHYDMLRGYSAAIFAKCCFIWYNSNETLDKAFEEKMPVDSSDKGYFFCKTGYPEVF